MKFTIEKNVYFCTFVFPEIRREVLEKELL